MNKILLSILCFCICCSCRDNEIHYSHDLRPTNDFLKYEVDSDVKIPLLVRTCTSDRELLYFQNGTWPEILIYDMYDGTLIKRNTFDVEGDNAIKGSFLHGFMMNGCSQIFISGMADGHFYETDTTGYIKKEYRYSESSNEYRPIACFKDNGDMQVIDGKLYFPQSLNWALGDEAMENSPLLCSVDLNSGKVERLPVTFPPELSSQSIVRGSASSVNLEYKCCFDGQSWVYSFAYMDELMIYNPATSQIEYKSGKSLYGDDVEMLSFRSAADDAIQRTVCESPAYGNILYDNENEVYYRIVYVPQEIDKNENALALLRSGRKQFSVMIYDEDFNVIGEHLFQALTYNPNLCFVSQGDLYISTNHVMNSDYSDDILCFQKMDLVELREADCFSAEKLEWARKMVLEKEPKVHSRAIEEMREEMKE